MHEVIMYTLRDVPQRLEPIADVIREEGKRLGFYEFELERERGASSLAFYVNPNNRTTLHVGLKYLSHLQDNRNVWHDLADGIVGEVVKHERNGHLNDGPFNFFDIYCRMEIVGMNANSEDAYMVFERQANLNEICLERKISAENLAHKIAVKLWSRSVYTPASYIEYLIRHDELKHLCISHSFIGELARLDGVEEKIKSVSYSIRQPDAERAKKIIGEFVILYLDGAYPWLKDGFKEKVVDEVLAIDKEYRERKFSGFGQATLQ